MEFYQRIANFLFEVGTMRKLPRIHRQVLLTDDTSDTISSHSYRVALIGWFLAKKEGADPYKVVMMCLLNDLTEARTADHNWIHKRYVKIFENEVHKEQLGTLPYKDMEEFVTEYDVRESKEAIIAKQADIVDQILLLREYDWQGNKEASIWLYGKGGADPRLQIKKLTLDSARELAEAIYTTAPSDWWDNLATGKNR